MEVSVIIPVYNSELFLVKCIKSALDQKQTGEVLLIDDRSTDDSLEICKKWEKLDSRVRVFINLGTKGAGAARNIGIRIASCDYIAFLDADDYYRSNRFYFTQIQFNDNPCIQAISEPVLMYNGDTKISSLVKYRKNNVKVSVKTFIIDSPFYITGLTIKKECIKDGILFDESLKQAEDTDFILRLINNFTVYSGLSDKPVCIYRIHNNNTTSNTEERNKSRVIFYKSYLKRALKLKNLNLLSFLFRRYLYYDFLVRNNNPTSFNLYNRLRAIPLSLLSLFKSQ